MGKFGSMKYQYNKIEKELNGIGISKYYSKNTSNLRAENGQKISPFVHSIKSQKNARNNINNLFRFAKENYEIKDVSKINKNIIKNWLLQKKTIDKITKFQRAITYKTASNYISEINKISKFLDITKDEMKELRMEIKDKMSVIEEVTRAYNISKLKNLEIDRRSEIAFELQRDYGLRVSAATHIVVNKRLNANQLSFKNKGGLLITKEISKGLANKIKEYAINGIYHVNKRTYSRDLKKAIIKSGEKWNGTHGLRHSYAQNMMETSTKKEVSLSMGHVRESITDTYLR